MTELKDSGSDMLAALSVGFGDGFCAVYEDTTDCTDFTVYDTETWQVVNDGIGELVDRPRPPTYPDVRQRFVDDDLTISEFEQCLETIIAVRGWEHIADALADQIAEDGE